MKGKKIILGLTGSIAIYKGCFLLRRLKEEGFLVKVVMTKNAREFIQPLLLERLSENKVYTDLFDKSYDYKIEHISLAKDADLVLIAPATANFIGKVACGIADDLLTSLVMATNAPVWICPAMDENMYKNRIVQENIKKLKSLGYKFIGPEKGKLASGEVGLGRLADIELIVKELKRYFKMAW
jgi:phosphopantothenoylcysteine decarboxylase/phosphopantothenate--cysteine ligase